MQTIQQYNNNTTTIQQQYKNNISKVYNYFYFFETWLDGRHGHGHGQ
jgi:hypothetical protein